MNATLAALFAALLQTSEQAPVAPVAAPQGSALREALPDAPQAPSPEGPLLPLSEALLRAREADPDLAVARERVVQAENQVDRAWAAVKPTLTANASYTRNAVGAVVFGGPGGFTQGSKNGYAASVAGAVTLFNGRAFPAIASAHQLVDVSRLNETQARRELLLQVASLYYSGAGLRELMQVAFRQSKATRDHAAQAQARFEAGQLQRSAALRARVDVVRADEEARRAVLSYQSTKSQLASLFDRHDTAFELETPQDPPDTLRAPLQQLVQRALDERPEMAAARAGEEIAARLKTDAWAQFLPTLALSGSYRYNDPSQVATGDATTWSFVLALTLPLYDGGFRYVALKDADSQLRQAKAQTRGQALRIEDELRRAQIELDSQRALRQETDQAVLFARENRELILAQFDAGTATQVEVSDAEAALYQSEASAVQQRLNVQLAALRLAKAIGAFDPAPESPRRNP